jgi:hypothetical protein
MVAHTQVSHVVCAEGESQRYEAHGDSRKNGASKLASVPEQGGAYREHDDAERHGRRRALREERGDRHDHENRRKSEHGSA